MRLKFYCENQRFNGKVDLYIVGEGTTNETVSVAMPLRFEQRRNEMDIQLPVVSLNQEDAQILMDGLWHCGLRPSEGTGSAGQLAATQKHLDDMRKIALTSVETKDASAIARQALFDEILYMHLSGARGEFADKKET